MDPKVVFDRTLIFEHELRFQAGNMSINDGIGESKDAIIHVENNDTIIANEQAGVTGGLVKTLSNQTMNKMLVPIMCGLFATIQILLELNEISIVCVFGVIKLSKPFVSVGNNTIPGVCTCTLNHQGWLVERLECNQFVENPMQRWSR